MFENTPLFWFIVGVVFALLELALPGLIVVFFALGAFVTAILSLFIDMGVTVQIIVFVSVSILSLIFLRKKIKSRFFQEQKEIDTDDDDLIGHQVIVTKEISPSHDGKVEFKGAAWSAKSDDTIDKGETVQIIGKDSIKLIVKPIKN